MQSVLWRKEIVLEMRIRCITEFWIQRPPCKQNSTDSTDAVPGVLALAPLALCLAARRWSKRALMAHACCGFNLCAEDEIPADLLKSHRTRIRR
jgi:hypothetical protein